MKPIIVPTDFSDVSKAALDAAIYIAGRKPHPLHLLHIIESPYTPKFSATGDIIFEDEHQEVYILKLMEKAKEELKKLEEYAKSQGIKNVTSNVRVDKVHNSINDSISEVDAELVVIGNRTKSTDDVLGSNAEKIIRRSKAPVMTIPANLKDIEIRNIVFASDFEENIENLIKKVSAFADIFSANLHLVRINTPSRFLSDAIGKNKVQEAAKKYNIENYTVHVYSDKTEEEGISNFAKEINADVIALGTHGRSGVYQVFKSSIAEGVAADSLIPVLTYNLKND